MIGKLKERILTEENLTKLVHLVNEEFAEGKSAVAELLQEKEAQLQEAKGKLQRLYAALETGRLDLADLAPRIKELRTQVEELERSKVELVKAGTIEKVEIGGPEVKAYVEDLQDLLLTGSVVERKSFLRSWIKRIDLDRPKGGTIEYTLPLVPTNGEHPSHLEVLSIEQAGVPGGI